MYLILFDMTILRVKKPKIHFAQNSTIVFFQKLLISCYLEARSELTVTKYEEEFFDKFLCRFSTSCKVAPRAHSAPVHLAALSPVRIVSFYYPPFIFKAK